MLETVFALGVIIILGRLTYELGWDVSKLVSIKKELEPTLPPYIEDLYKPDPREEDYIFEQIYGVNQPVPRVHINKTTVQNQYIEDYTKYACTCYAASHALVDCLYQIYGVELNERHKSGRQLRTEAFNESNPPILNGGRHEQGPLEMMRKNQDIVGYARVNTLQGVKQALSQGVPLVTSAYGINWAYTWNNKIVLFDNTHSAHAFTIHGYDDNSSMLICKDSSGPNAYDKGYFYIKYEDFSKITPPYFIDVANKILYDKARKTACLNRAIKLGLWNGSEPTRKATLKEAQTVYTRVNTLIKKFGLKLSKFTYTAQSRETEFYKLFKEAKDLLKTREIKDLL